jgi:molybdopterin converting factor small subunit
VERDPDAAAEPPTVTLRYWAAIRDVAGCAEEEFAAATVADLLTAAGERHADQRRFGPVLAICSLLVGGQPVGSRDPSAVTLEDGSVVEALPPFAGG